MSNKRNDKDVTLETISFRLSASSCDHDELSYVMRCLERMTKCQNAMIKRNKRTRFTVKSAFSSKIARDTIITCKTDESWATNRAWTVVNDQSEAYRVLKAWRDRVALYKLARRHGGDYNAVTVAVGHAPNRRLFENVSRMSAPPRLPVIESARLVFPLFAGQMGEKTHYDRATGTLSLANLSIGSRRVNVHWDAGWLRGRFPSRSLKRISKPIMQVIPRDPFSYDIAYDDAGHARVSKTRNTVVFDPAHDDVLVSFVIRVRNRRPSKPSNHVAGFDLGMDSTKPFSGVRASSNGWLSRELGPSTLTNRLKTRIHQTKRQLGYCLDRITRLHALGRSIPSGLHDACVNTYRALYRREDAMDWRIAVDMINSCKQGDTLVMEYLAWAGGGRVKFRHGRVQSRVQHAARKRGIRVKLVNPAYSSQECPACGARVTHHDRLNVCRECGTTIDRDRAASIIIARRGLNRKDHATLPTGYCNSSNTPHKPRAYATSHIRRTCDHAMVLRL